MHPHLPSAVEAYFAAADAGDVEGALATFGDDATVFDDGHTYAGRDVIRAWLDGPASQYRFTRTPLGVEPIDDGHLVTCRLEGDFPGGVVDLRYRFDLNGDRIDRLHIAP